jgi:putative tryptophan/tyrosine transport system permease protein
VAQQYDYSPFGQSSVMYPQGPTTPFQFTGREHDQTGLYYYRGRYYVPEWGRFLSEDPIGFGGGIDPYACVGNIPAPSAREYGNMAALWLGAITQGLAFAFLAWAIYLSFRVLAFADITVDGSFTLGAAVAAVLLARGVNPLWAILAAIAAGGIAGVITAVIHTWFGIADLLAGILTMTALYSVNLHVMGRSNISLLQAETVVTRLHKMGLRFGEDWLWLGFLLLLAVLCKLGLDWFLRTDFGMAMRATGENPQMVTALGVDTRRMIVVGLALSNGLVGLCGALIAQYQGFADVGMGVGSLVAGMAAVMIGEALVGRWGLGWIVAGAAVGSVLFRLLIALALVVGLNPNDLKLVTAVFVFVALVLTRLRGRRRTTKAPASRLVEERAAV